MQTIARRALAALAAPIAAFCALCTLHGATASPPRQEVPAAEYGYLVDMQVWADQDWSHQCGATLVSDRVVVTADHCVADDFDLAATRFVFGDAGSPRGSDTVVGSDLIAIVRVAPGPEFHDVAVIVLPNARTESTIALGHAEPPIGTTTDMISWRDAGIGRRVSERTPMTIRPSSDCNARMDGDVFAQREGICAGVAGDVRHGDSGGPLVERLRDGPELVGIVSNGANGRPTGFTDMTDPALLRALVAAAPEHLRELVADALVSTDGRAP